MEYVQGETLSQVLARGPLSLDATRRYAAEMADALDAAHRTGVVHRDLKPANVMLTDGGTKLLDFGIAKLIAHDGKGATPTDAVYGTGDGSVVGTAGYMSPEQARGHVVDKRADIWAFGCLLYEMLSGRPAFARDTLGDTLTGMLVTQTSRDVARPRPLRLPLVPPVLIRSGSVQELAEAAQDLAGGSWSRDDTRIPPHSGLYRTRSPESHAMLTAP